MSLVKQHILVTRPEPQGQELCILLKKQGATAYYIPTLEIHPRTVHLNLLEFDMVIFISVNAVKYYPFKTFSKSARYFAVGAATAAALMERGIIAQQPEYSHSEGLLALPELKDVQGKEIAIFCGIGGRDFLQQTLRNRGAHCQCYEVYERHCALQEANRLQILLKEVALDYVICTSGENLLCLEKLAGSQIVSLRFLQLVVISERIAAIARERGFSRVLVINEPFDNISIVQQLMKWKEKTL